MPASQSPRRERTRDARRRPRAASTATSSSTGMSETSESFERSSRSARPRRSFGHPKGTRLHEFSGENPKQTLVHFIAHVEAHRSLNGWTSKETAQLVSGEAQMAIEELEEVPRKWEGMKKALRDRFESAGLEEKHRSELMARRRKESETLAQFVSELRRLGKLSYPLIERSQREDFLKDVFVRGQGSDFREAILTQRMGTLTDVVQLA